MILDHIDLRCRVWRWCGGFYAVLLPALGFTRDVSDGKWFQLEAADGSRPTSSRWTTSCP